MIGWRFRRRSKIRGTFPLGVGGHEHRRCLPGSSPAHPLRFDSLPGVCDLPQSDGRSRSWRRPWRRRSFWRRAFWTHSQRALGKLGRNLPLDETWMAKEVCGDGFGYEWHANSVEEFQRGGAERSFATDAINHVMGSSAAGARRSIYFSFSPVSECASRSLSSVCFVGMLFPQHDADLLL